MQSKRKKRTRIRAAKVTAGHGHKKKNRGAGHRGGRGKAGSGKRGNAKIMKITSGNKYLGKTGFTSIKSLKPFNIITLKEIQDKLPVLISSGKMTQNKDIFEINLTELGYDKLLAKGNVAVKLNIVVNSASKNAIAKIEAAKGKVILPDSKVQEKNKQNSEENI